MFKENIFHITLKNNVRYLYTEQYIYRIICRKFLRREIKLIRLNKTDIITVILSNM